MFHGISAELLLITEQPIYEQHSEYIIGNDTLICVIFVVKNFGYNSRN